MRTIFCTKEEPWDHAPRKLVMILHPDAQQTDYVELNADTGRSFHVERYCPNCKFEWKRELPE